MSRDLPLDMATAVATTGSVPYSLHLLAEFRFDSQTIGMWTGVGNLVYNSMIFVGGGNLVGVGAYEETQDLQAKGMVFTLSGVPLSLISIAENEPYQGRAMRLHLALLNPDRTINSAYRLFSGIMDTMDIKEGAETATIQLACESVLMLLKRTKERRYTDEDQKARFPADNGLSFIAQLQDKELVW